jgi:hypothetical protein
MTGPGHSRPMRSKLREHVCPLLPENGQIVVGLELGNVVANYPFEVAAIPGSRRIHRDHFAFELRYGGTQVGLVLLSASIE